MASPTDPMEQLIERRRPRLVSIHGAHLGKRWLLEACGVVIGRDPAQAGLALPDAAVSARHCALELEPVSGEFTVSDLGSRNGTFVNGEKVAERHLAEGDKLFVGETVLEFTWDDALGAGFHSGIDGRVDVDALTGLLVKRAFDLELARAFARASEGAGSLCLLMLDVEELKSVTDDKARKTGSLCIAEVGRIIRQRVSTVGCACRFGGDRFIALLHPFGLARGVELAEQIRARVEAYRFERDGKQVQPTISIGIVELEPGLATPDHLLQLTDEALYRAKRAGRNQVSR